MVFKLNIGHKGKSWKLELADEGLSGKSVGDKFMGDEIKPELAGYELQITGGSDNAGFPMFQEVEGIGLKRVLLTKGKGMRNNKAGLRLRKTVRAKTISAAVSQINIKVLKVGAKKLEEVFPDQNKKEEAKAEAPAA
ncbi:MAG TPA: S6e family ribosomal protein [Candidatus Nanoarchaeia archaeon]|nr:S6e family ribosomal protein [Candidatus Nanoarchaeia archaeon]